MKLGWSNFAIDRHVPCKGYSYFNGDNDELLEVVRENWYKRRPGNGRTDLDKVVVVPVPAQDFVGTTVTINDDLILKADVVRRQPQESPFVKVVATSIFKGYDGGEYNDPIHEAVKPDLVNFASVVMYSADALLENNGERSGDFDWEITAIVCSSIENELPHPLTMARNMLQKPGGTFCKYTAEELAESIYYWSQRVSIK